MWDIFDRVLRTIEEQLAAIWRAILARILIPIAELVAGAGRFVFRKLLPGIARPIAELLGAAWRLIFFRSTSDVFYVTGRRLRDNDRVPVTLRGVNLPLLDDWDFPASDRLAEVEKSGANAVRIQWYAQYPDPARPAYSIAHLDAFLDRCRLNRLIPILELHDCTCQADPQRVNTQLIPWWTRADVVKVLRRHERYLIINLANELGEYRFAGATPAALDAFKNAYKQAISSIRAQGLRMPIMIDAPDCGTSLHALVSIGQELITHDPRHSLLLSAHAYWAGWDGTAHVTAAVNANLPIVIGEVANKQFDNGDQCFYGLDGTGINNPPPTGFQYQNLLALLAQKDVGWLAWAWHKDLCEHRRITTDGNFANLTPYGQDILNNPTYGILSGAYRAQRSGSLPGAPPGP